MKSEERRKKSDGQQHSALIPHNVYPDPIGAPRLSPSNRQSAIHSPLSAALSAEGLTKVEASAKEDRSTLLAPRSTTAFTLIEVMVVLVIISILAGIIVGAAKYAMTKAGRSRAQAEIAAMETALECYKADWGYYPVSGTNRVFNTNSYVVFTALAAGPKKYMEFKVSQLQIVPVPPRICTNILDPFGIDYSYYCLPGAGDQTNKVAFDLWSCGQDGQNDTADDIVNWRH